MPIIDCHTHILAPEIVQHREHYCAQDAWFRCLYEDPEARMASALDLLTSMQDAGIDQSVASGFAFADLGLCRLGNDYVLQAASDHPGRIMPFALVNPCSGAAALREAQRCLEQGACGLGELLPDGQGFALQDDAILEPLMELARAFGVPVLFHVNELVGHHYAGKGRQGPQQAFHLAQRYPDNILILAHWGAGLAFYELMPEVRQTLHNVYYDTAASPYLYEDSIFEHVLSWAPDKVLFATDYPLIAQGRFVRRIRRLGLDERKYDRLVWENAQTVLGYRVARGD